MSPQSSGQPGPPIRDAPDGEAYTLPAGEPMAIEDIGDALVIRERSTFLLTDANGDVPGNSPQGFGVYHADTRHLSKYRLTLDGIDPVVLLSTAELGYAMEQVLTNPTLVSSEGETIERGRLEIRRQRTVADVVEEVLRVTNFGTSALTLAARYEFGADFADIFDVRGYERRKDGVRHRPVVGRRAITYRYTGIDAIERSTDIVFDRDPDAIDERCAFFRIHLAPHETATLRFAVIVDDLRSELARPSRFRSVRADYQEWMRETTQISTDNELFNRVLDQSLRDVRMLLSRDEHGNEFPAAGTPWFDALFGRDSAITSMQMLAYRPDIARSTLMALAARQGDKLDPAHDEEPGKILHEMRRSELSRAGELPYGPYYGTVDATPLFLILAAEYYAWSGDLRFIRELLPNIKSAFEWLDIYGDATNTGYLCYEKRSAKGLVNQGWKDSWDAITHTDGTLAPAPIALAEVQGYAYAARNRMAPILDRLGEHTLAEELRVAAKSLRERFNREFWSDASHNFAMARDGTGRLVESLGSNAAHCLWGGLIDKPKAGDVAQNVLGPELFSGWGIRTLERSNPRFNPIGYHVGSVWPHDNSLIVMGLKMYGFEDAVNSVASALFDTALTFPYFRLPELFGGDVRSQHRSPVPYPVACRPQAWAAGSMPYIAQAMLGLHAEAPDHRLRIVNPRLPKWLNSVHVRGLRVGSGTVSLQYRRSGKSTNVEVQRITGNVDVVVSQRWPL